MEVGCAAGYFLDEATRAGWQVIGVEPAAEIAELARSTFGLDVRTGFVEDLDLSELTADVVCAWHTLEHIPDPFDLVVSLRALMADSGTVAVEVPNGATLSSRTRKVTDFCERSRFDERARRKR
ncbi:MAG: class I SAM-dependent methyltransferase [Solirubrobacterales bacterium]